jgi:hypothetical protein
MKKIIIAATVVAAMSSVAFAAPGDKGFLGLGSISPSVGVRVGNTPGLVLAANMDKWTLALNLSNKKDFGASTNKSVRSKGLTVTYAMGNIVLGATQQSDDSTGDPKTSSALIGFTGKIGADTFSCMTNLYSKMKKTNDAYDGSGEFDKSYCTFSHAFGGAAAK